MMQRTRWKGMTKKYVSTKHQYICSLSLSFPASAAGQTASCFILLKNQLRLVVRAKPIFQNTERKKNPLN